MRIIEGYGPPSPDTFGNPSYLYKDLDTGAFYRCHGNINEDRILPYGPAHRHPGEQYVWTPVPHVAEEIVNEPLNITWDGNTESCLSVDDIWYQVSDIVLTDEQIKSATVATDEFSFDIADRWDEMVSDGNVQADYASTPGTEVIFIRKDGTEMDASSFPACGIYFRRNVMELITAPVPQTKTVIHPMDPMFMPEGVGGVKTVFHATSIHEDCPYLYVDEALEIKATKADVVDAFKKGEIYVYNHNQTCYQRPTAVSIYEYESYANVLVYNPMNGDFVHIYTSERKAGPQ